MEDDVKKDILDGGKESTSNSKKNIKTQETGPLNWKQLVELNEINYTGSEDSKKLQDSFKIMDYTLHNVDDFINYEDEGKIVQTPLYNPEKGDYWGNSMFDAQSGIKAEEIGNLADIRANNQPGIAKLGAGVGKMGLLAVTTFVDGIAGSVVGLINLSAEASSGNVNSWSEGVEAFVRNPLSEALQSINEASESWLPNYYTQRELENDESGQWYKNVFTTNFWGDKFIKNVGFTLGAAASAIVTSGAASKAFVNSELRNAFKGTVYKAAKEGGERVALSNADDVYKAMRNGEQLFTKSGEVIEEGSKLMKDLQKSAEQLKRAEWGLKLAGSVNSAMGEGRIEAISAVKELQDKEYNNINTWANNAVEGVRNQMFDENPKWFQLVNVGTPEKPKYENQLTPEGQEEYNKRIKYITDKKNALLQQASMKSADIANYVFLSNVALLSFSNFVQFGRAMSGGFTTANNFKNLIKNVTKNEAKKEGAKEVLKGTTKRLGEEGVEASINKGAIRRKIARAATSPLMEGFEEISQASIAAGAGLQIGSELNQYAKEYNTGLMYDSLYADSIDLDAQETAVDYLNSLLDGAAKTYGKSQSWEEFSIGFITGLLGIPKVGRKANGKKGLQMSGEFWEGIKDAKQMKKEAQELVNAINARINTPEMKEYYKGLIRHTKGEKDKLDFLMRDDQFNYNNSEFKQLISDALMFDKAGRLEDFYSMIDDYAKLTGDEQESLRTIIANSKYNVTDDNGNIVRDANGNPVQKTVYDGYSIERMNVELKKRADKARKAVDFYVKNSNALKALYGDNISRDVLEEMVYGLSQLDNWSDRSREMMSDISRALHGDFSTAKEYGVEVENIDEDIIKSFEDVQTLFGKGDKNIINTLLNAIKKGNLAPEDFVKYYDKLQTMKSHKKNLMESTKERISAADKETVKTLVEELNTYKQNKEIDVKVKENILNNILSLAKTPQDKIDLFQMDFNLMEDFKEVLDEAIDTLGTATVAKKIIEWKNFLNKSIVTSKFAERKNGKVLSTAEALNNLYKSLYANTEEKEQAFKEKLEKELAASNKEKKNAIKENYLKSIRNLNDIIKDINTKLHNIKNVNNINLLKYEKMINDLVLIQASRAVVLDKLKDLSEHPEYYTESAQEYLKEVENKIKEQASEQLKRKLANCKTVQDIREAFENDDISTFSKQQEMLNSIVNDVNEDLQSLIKDYIKIEKFKIATLSVDSKSNETNADVSSKVILKVLNTIDEAQDFNSIIENLEFTKFSKDLSKEEKEYAKGFLERIFTAYNASENTKKDKKEEPTEKSVESKTTNSRLRNMVNKDVAEMEKESMQQSKEDGIPENVSTGEAEAEDNSQDDDTVEENSNDEYLEKLSKKSADEQVASLSKKSIEKLEEIEKGANEEQKKLIEEVKKGKPTKELPNYTNNTAGQESVKFPNNKQTDIVDETKNTVENTLADNSGRMAFDNWTYTLYNIYAAKKALMQTNTFNGEKFAENAQKYLSFMSEYNADRYINEGFLGLKYLKAKREGKDVKIHLLQIADSRMEYSRPNNQNTNEKHYTILQCVALDENEVKELENTWGKNKVKLIKNEYTVEGKKKTEYYQVVGSLHYSNNNLEAKSLKRDDAEFYKNLREAKFKTIQNRIDFINESLFNNNISESLSKTLIKEKQILEMGKIWSAINSSFEGLREKAITNNSVDSNLSIVQGSNDENKVENSMGTEKSGPYIIKNSQMQSAIKTIYSGRLVKGTLDSNLNPNDKANIENANWQGETDLKDIPLNNNGEKLNGNTLQLGFYYGNGTLAIPLASPEDEVVPLKANNNKFIASTGPDGKLYNTAGSVWVMVRTADGKLYPKGLSVKRFNEKEYPKEKHFNRNDTSAKTIMNIIYSNAKVMADPNASQTEKARAKIAIMNVLYIPKKYSFGFDNDGKTVYINNKNGGYSRSINIDVEAIKNADEETQRTLINDYAEQIIDALHDNQFSFRFQVSPSRVKKDGDGSYRQLLLDSNVFTTNLPVLENIGASFDTYPILHDGKKWKVVKDDNVNVEKSTSVPKATDSMSNNNNDIKYGEYSFIVKEENGTLTVIPNANAQNIGKKTASPEEQCAIKLLYNLNKGITNREIVKGSNIYSVTTNAGNHTFYFEVDESNKLTVKKLEGTLEEITQRANTKLNNKKMNNQENLASDADLNELAKLQGEAEELSSIVGNQSSTDSMNKEIEEALQNDADFINGGVRQEKQEKPVETKEEKTVSSNLKLLQQNVEQQGKTRQTVSSDKKLKLMAINKLNKKAKEKGYESYDKFVEAHQDNPKIIPTTDPIFDTLTKETAQTITEDIIKCM